MALTGIQIYKMLPQTNCKECGFPTCLAFAMKLAAKQVELDDCPYVTDESKAQLAESAAPPIRLIEFSAGARTVRAGNEVVLFRHEKTFYNRPGLVLRVRDTEDEPAIETRVSAAGSYTVDYVGMDLTLDGFAVECASGDAGKFVAAVEAVRRATDRPLVLISGDPAVLETALEAVPNEHPLLLGARTENWEQIADLALGRSVPIGVHGSTVDELAELTGKLKERGIEEMVLVPEAGALHDSLRIQTQIRRLALKNERALGYPTVAFAAGVDEPGRESVRAAQSICKYAGFVVLDTFAAEMIYPLLVLRENIFTDPQKPIQVQPNLYELNDPGPDDPLLVTTNFSITYFSVANEVEGSGLPAWLLVTDAEGMSVLTAWAAGKFDAESIAKAVKEFGVADRVSRHRIVLPGHVAVISGELEEELPGWEIMVGPREAVDIPAYMKTAMD